MSGKKGFYSEKAGRYVTEKEFMEKPAELERVGKTGLIARIGKKRIIIGNEPLLKTYDRIKREG